MMLLFAAVQEERGPRRERKKKAVLTPTPPTQILADGSTQSFFRALIGSLSKMAIHPDLVGLTTYEKIMLAHGRWMHFFVLTLAQWQEVISLPAHKELDSLTEAWKSLGLHSNEWRLVEVLALTGRGMAHHPSPIASKIAALNDVVYMALAKYEVCNFPLDPIRLTQISLLLSRLESVSPILLANFLANHNPLLISQLIQHAFISI